jgi:hypothetical protein
MTHANPGRRAELGALLLDLDGELTRRGDDEDDRPVTGVEKRLGVDVLSWTQR